MNEASNEREFDRILTNHERTVKLSCPVSQKSSAPEGGDPRQTLEAYL